MKSVKKSSRFFCKIFLESLSISSSFTLEPNMAASQVMSLASIMMPGCSLPSSMGPSTTTSSLLPTSPSSTSSSDKTRPAAASSPRGSAATAEQMERPSLSYKDLIIEAIESSKEKRLKLNEIYQVSTFLTLAEYVFSTYIISLFK